MKRLIVAAVAAALLYLAPLAVEAAVTNTPVLVQTPKVAGLQFLQGTDVAGTYKTLYTGGANGSKIVGIYATSFDPSAAHLVTVQLSTSTSAHCSPATSCFGGTAVNVPVSSGSLAAAPPVNLMSATNWPGLPVDSDGNPFLYLSGNTQTIEVTFATALTASDWINVVIVVADF